MLTCCLLSNFVLTLILSKEHKNTTFHEKVIFLKYFQFFGELYWFRHFQFWKADFKIMYNTLKNIYRIFYENGYNFLMLLVFHFAILDLPF